MKDVGILKQALPYIRKYKGRVFVVKLGGELVAEPEVLDDIAQDLSLIYLIGIKLVVVHGGGPQATELSKRLGVVPKFVEGRRVTDEESLEIVKMVLAGKINHEILTILRKHGVRSVGLSGIDGDVVIAERRSPVELIDRESGEKNSIDYGHVGDIKKINPDLLNVLLENGYVPVIASLSDDGRGNILNINADTVASHIAVAMGAYKYITMTNVSGVLRDINDPESRISYMSDNEAEELINNGTIKGGMIPKIKECIYAVRGGVKRVHILNGFEKNSLLVEVFTRGGQGTMILGINEIEEYRKGDL